MAFLRSELERCLAKRNGVFEIQSNHFSRSYNKNTACSHVYICVSLFLGFWLLFLPASQAGVSQFFERILRTITPAQGRRRQTGVRRILRARFKELFRSCMSCLAPYKTLTTPTIAAVEHSSRQGDNGDIPRNAKRNSGSTAKSR